MNTGTQRIIIGTGAVALTATAFFVTRHLSQLQEASDQMEVRLGDFETLRVSGGDLEGKFQLAFVNIGDVDLKLQEVQLGIYLDGTELSRIEKIDPQNRIPASAKSTPLTFQFETPIVSTALGLVSQLVFSGVPKQGLLKGKVKVSGFMADIQEIVPLRFTRKDESTSLSGYSHDSHLVLPWTSTCAYG